MEWDLRKAALPFFAPLLLLAAAFAVVEPVRALPRAVTDISAMVPFALAVLGAAMAIWFQRRRVVYSFLVLAVAYGALHGLFPNTPGKGPEGQVVFAALAFLLPINLTVYAFLEEKGLLTLHGVARLAAIGLQAAAVAVAAEPAFWKDAAELLHLRLFDAEYDKWTWLPQPAMHAYTVCFAILLGRLAWTRQPLDGGALGALSASAVALHMVGSGAAPSLFMAVAMLAWVVALAQEAYRMAFLDELTALPGRRALMGLLKTVSGRYTIAMLDVDHFKKFNDTYGHDVGDQVLRMVASRMERVTGGGKSFRYGGEEFTVVFPNRSQDEAKVHLEALRESIAASSFRLRGPERPDEKPEHPEAEPGAETVSVTISIGMAEKAPEHPDPMAVIKSADEALYRAKEGGRNRVSA